MTKKLSENFIAYVLVAAILFMSIAVFVPSFVRSVSAEEVVVTETSSGNFDDFTKTSNQELGITGSKPDVPKTGDSNASFVLNPSVSFENVQTVKTYNPAQWSRQYSIVSNGGDRSNLWGHDESRISITKNAYYAYGINDNQVELRNRGKLTAKVYYYSEVTGDETILDYSFNKRDFFADGDFFTCSLSELLNFAAYTGDSSLDSSRILDIKITANKYDFCVSDVIPVTSVSVAGGKAKMTYTLRLDSTDLSTITDNAVYDLFFDVWRVENTYEQLITRYYVYFNRDNINKWIEDQWPYRFVFRKRAELTGDGETIVAKKDFINGSGSMSMRPIQKYSDFSGSGADYETMNRTQTLTDCGYEILYSSDQRHYDGNGNDVITSSDFLNGLKINTLNGSPVIYLDIDTDDYDAEYRCRFGYKVYKMEIQDGAYKAALSKRKGPVPVLFKAGLIESTANSIYGVLNGLETSEQLEEVYEEEELEIAQNIIEDKTVRTVDLIRLVQIEGTPFARKVVEHITVPVRDGAISYDSVCEALGIDSLKVMNSNVESIITMNRDGQYELVYLKAAWLHAKSVSGNSIDSFLDLNESYETFYNRQTGFNIERDSTGRIVTADANASKAIMTRGMYEYFLNEIKLKFPQLEGYQGNEIYGYWGFFAIPQEYNLDAAWAEIFGNSTQYKNIAYYFRHDVSLSRSAYNSLINDYGHSYLEKIFENIAGTAFGFDATYYMVYMDDAGLSVVSENGSTDTENDDGLYQNTVVRPIFNFMKGIGTWLASNSKTLIPIIIIVAIIVAGVVIIVKYDVKGKGGKRRR